MITIEAPDGLDLAVMISEVKRELSTRRFRKYERNTDQQMRAMSAVLTLLEGIRDAAAQSRCQAQGRLEG